MSDEIVAAINRLADEQHRSNQLKAIELFILYNERLTSDVNSVRNCAIANLIEDVATEENEILPYDEYRQMYFDAANEAYAYREKIRKASKAVA